MFIIFLNELNGEGRPFLKLFFQMNLQVYSLPGQTVGERKAIFRKVQHGIAHREITPNIWLRDGENLYFCEI